MNRQKRINARRTRRSGRVRRRLRGDEVRPRLSVFRRHRLIFPLHRFQDFP